MRHNIDRLFLILFLSLFTLPKSLISNTFLLNHSFITLSFRSIPSHLTYNYKPFHLSLLCSQGGGARRER
jgi:hypothetical protein